MKTISRLLRSSDVSLGILAAAIGFYSFASSAKAQGRPDKPATEFDLSIIQEEMVKEFRQAWIWANSGGTRIEGLVLVYQRPDGSYKAAAQKPTNEILAFTFKWSPDVIAVVHTHPNNSDRKPSGADLVFADRFGVPIFTITDRGMYMYDPATRRITKIKESLDWLNSDSWVGRGAKAR